MFWTTIILGYWRLYVGIFLVASAFVCGWGINGWRLGHDISDLKRQYAEEREKAEKEARLKEEDWQLTANSIRKANDEQVKSINTQLNVAISQLRERQARPPASDLPQNPIVGQGGTGGSLYAQDAEFLAREAARADILRSALNECYAQYDSISK